MKVKVGDKIYDGKNEPIMIILNKGEKQQIANMHPDATRYCQCPTTEEWTDKKIEKWMEVEPEPDALEVDGGNKTSN